MGTLDLDVWKACWKKCSQCMEQKASTLENEKVAKLWREKIEKCRVCREEYLESLKRYDILDPLEQWASSLRRCSVCMLDDMSRIAETGDLEAAAIYKKLLNQCIDCMFRGFDDVKDQYTP
ncbi:MAG: hypothetical protein HXS46_18685 [Theionarchaea archaeon]|nr:hypothetical protein [Theionarchaea archaeon]